MKWFKHYSNTTMVEPVCHVYQDMGFSGLGVLWLLVERIVFLDGAMRLSEACNIVVSKHFTRKKLISLITGYDIFILDETQGTISLDPTFIRLVETEASTQKGPSKVPAKSQQSPSKVPASPSLAPASCCTNPVEKENKKEKEREEEQDEEIATREGGGPENAALVEGDPENAALVEGDGPGNAALVETMVCTLSDGPKYQYWCETLMMNRPQVKTLLQKDFAWCLRHFLLWSISTGNELPLRRVGEAKRYFCNFCGNPQTIARMNEAWQREQQQVQSPPSDDAKRFERSMHEHFPNIASMRHPLTLEQYNSLRSELCDDARLLSLLQRMENTRQLCERYNYAYLTARQYLRHGEVKS